MTCLSQWYLFYFCMNRGQPGTREFTWCPMSFDMLLSGSPDQGSWCPGSVDRWFSHLYRFNREQTNKSVVVFALECYTQCAAGAGGCSLSKQCFRWRHHSCPLEWKTNVFLGALGMIGGRDVSAVSSIEASLVHDPVSVPDNSCYPMLAGSETVFFHKCMMCNTSQKNQPHNINKNRLCIVCLHLTNSGWFCLFVKWWFFYFLLSDH